MNKEVVCLHECIYGFVRCVTFALSLFVRRYYDTYNHDIDNLHITDTPFSLVSAIVFGITHCIIMISGLEKPCHYVVKPKMIEIFLRLQWCNLLFLQKSTYTTDSVSCCLCKCISSGTQYQLVCVQF